MPASDHETVFERRSEREAVGRLTRALWEGMEKQVASNLSKDSEAGRDITRAHKAMAAGVGGLTSFLSLAPGSERVLVDRSSAYPCGINNGPSELQQLHMLGDKKFGRSEISGRRASRARITQVSKDHEFGSDDFF